MSRVRRERQAGARWRRWITGVSLLGAASACGTLGTPSKVRTGELYVSGSPRYDAYFSGIHAEQVAAAGWPEERTRARKPLVDALKLTTAPDDATLTQMTKDGMSGGTLRLEVQGTEAHIVSGSAARHDAPRELIAGVEQTAEAEMARAKKLAELPPRLDALAKAGHALEAHLGEDFGGEGQKPFEVREELFVSYDALEGISASAKHEQQAAEQFVAELGRAVAAGSEAPATSPGPAEKATKLGASKAQKPPPKPEEPAKPAKPARPASPPPPSPPKATPPPAAPKPAEHTEVFSP
jgi:hypothetical protein